MASASQSCWRPVRSRLMAQYGSTGPSRAPVGLLSWFVGRRPRSFGRGRLPSQVAVQFAGDFEPDSRRFPSAVATGQCRSSGSRAAGRCRRFQALAAPLARSTGSVIGSRACSTSWSITRLSRSITALQPKGWRATLARVSPVSGACRRQGSAGRCSSASSQQVSLLVVFWMLESYLAVFDLVQRRLGDIDAGCARPVRAFGGRRRSAAGCGCARRHVGIGHDDDAVVAQFVRVVILCRCRCRAR